MKETQREGFRWAPHTGGLTIVKLKDFEAGEKINAESPYAAWKQMLSEGRRLQPGDLLETIEPESSSGTLQITKYIGFEPAQWFVPDPRPASPDQGPVITAV